MKKLKRKELTIYLQKVRSPQGMTLSQYLSFYEKLKKKYSHLTGELRLMNRYTYYSGSSGNWLVEKRMESTKELAQRQAKLDAEVARRKAAAERRRKQLSLMRARERAKQRIEAKRRESALRERKVEEVKNMVSILKEAGYSISVKSNSRR